MSRSDLKELGDLIDEGEAALLIVAESRLSEAIEKAQLRAAKRIAKQFDIDPKEVDDAVKQAAGQLA
jgi:hypothetical protein